MSTNSKIEWTDATWNPFRGCTRISPGCQNCYAERMAARNLPNLKSPTTGEPFAIMTESGPRWTNRVEAIESRLDAPTHWRKPRRIFVNSLSDTWHDGFSYQEQSVVASTAIVAQQHTYIFLTKRAAIAMRFWERFYREYGKAELDAETMDDCAGRSHRPWPAAPFRNVHMGVSCEDQHRLDERIEDLRATPAAVRWLSLEPLLGPIDLAGRLDGIHWVVVGGESGPGARLCNIEWIRGIVRQCKDSGVPCFVKQLGAFPFMQEGMMRIANTKGGDPSEWPEDLRVQEYPARVEKRGDA